ncbi:MAG: deoxyribodipyrimidine photo-lyase [Steroidobacteraceae bacterium]|jgi:deoxyribodipyrimidine photo-lyase|nr:deoxyribodipyrimidine photo-lyase [Steroidobacteraceae bacterium]
MTLQVVWFKRDLRVHDHAPLHEAAACGPVLPLVVVEPEYWRLPDVSARQWRFQRGAIEDLARALGIRGAPLQIAVGDVVDVLMHCRVRHGAFRLWSHEETGNAWTYARDRRVAAWCRAQGVEWRQRMQFGVWRGARLDRDRWSADWHRLMMRRPLPAPGGLASAPATFDGQLPAADELGLAPDGLRFPLEPGRRAAIARLDSFLHARGQRYTREMSSPVTAERACSRLSQDLAYGTLSLREVVQAARRRAAAVEDDPTARGWSRSLASFASRLHWHCHFIQKLDAEPEVETRPFARAYEGLRPRPGDATKLAAWAAGRTGYPFVDAAMRYLAAHGWINFRMRAMLTSFATYDLWLPWQEAGLHLARQFVDYEPGIHWPQCQMQAGETGINTLRVYSPVKQGREQDPSGEFVRRWVPELAGVAGAAVHDVPRWSEAERRAQCPDYPAPIVDHAVAARAALDALQALRRRDDARAEADAVQAKHGSRRRRTPRRPRVDRDPTPAAPRSRRDTRDDGEASGQQSLPF